MVAAKLKMPSVYEALPGRDERMRVASRHFVLDAPLDAAFEGFEIVTFGLGCFWGAERAFWEIKGVVSTQVGYAGGFTPNPTYEEVCSGKTGHAEVVRVVFDPRNVPFDQLLRVFWEAHDPTQGMRQGNDLGTQYRSAIYLGAPSQLSAVSASRLAYQQALENQATVRSRPRFARTSRSTSPRTRISSTWRRTRAATAGSGHRHFVPERADARQQRADAVSEGAASNRPLACVRVLTSRACSLARTSAACSRTSAPTW